MTEGEMKFSWLVSSHISKAKRMLWQPKDIHFNTKLALTKLYNPKAGHSSKVLSVSL